MPDGMSAAPEGDWGHGISPTRRGLRSAVTTLGGEDALDYRDPHSVSRSVSFMVDAGRRDAALGRLYEGHINALQLLYRYGDQKVRDFAASAKKNDALLGCWNHDDPDDPLRVRDGRLVGRKGFCSGAGLLTHALVTTEASDPEQCRMWLADVRGDVQIDTSWWDPVGMARSETHFVRWTGDALPPVPVGAPGDYQKQPFFGGGALRFAAVQAGSVAGLFDGLLDALAARGRETHPMQRRRLAEAHVCAQAAIDAVCGLARHYHEDDPDLSDRIGGVRHAVMERAEEQIIRVQRSAGVQGLMTAHPLATRLTDLMMYIRQPDPDGALDRYAEAVISGSVDFSYGAADC